MNLLTLLGLEVRWNAVTGRLELWVDDYRVTTSSPVNPKARFMVQVNAREGAGFVKAWMASQGTQDPQEVMTYELTGDPGRPHLDLKLQLIIPPAKTKPITLDGWGT